MNAVVQTIAEQIGPRAFLMMGTRYRIADGDTLIFDIRGSRAYNKVRVTLTPLDTYTVQFIKCRGVNVTNQHEVSDVYCDQLHACIESNTGLYLSL